MTLGSVRMYVQNTSKCLRHGDHAGTGFRLASRKHQIRRLKPEQILDILGKRPLRVAPGTAEAASAHLKLLLRQLLLVRQHRRDSDQLLERWFNQLKRASEPPYSDAAILASLPGVGAFVLASLLSHAHDPVRLRNLEAFRSLGGVAPSPKRAESGETTTADPHAPSSLPAPQ